MVLRRVPRIAAASDSFHLANISGYFLAAQETNRIFR
jgi:hypothetical protein